MNISGKPIFVFIKLIEPRFQRCRCFQTVLLRFCSDHLCAHVQFSRGPHFCQSGPTVTLIITGLLLTSGLHMQPKGSTWAQDCDEYRIQQDPQCWSTRHHACFQSDEHSSGFRGQLPSTVLPRLDLLIFFVNKVLKMKDGSPRHTSASGQNGTSGQQFGSSSAERGVAEPEDSIMRMKSCMVFDFNGWRHRT